MPIATTVRGTPTVPVLGVKISAICLDSATERVQTWVEARERRYVCVADVHSVMESVRDPSLRQIHNKADMVTPDGMPVVWMCRLGGRRETGRVYGPDLMLECCQRFVEHGYRHFLYGGRAGVADLLAERLVRRFPGLEIAGTLTPPFRPLTPDEDAEAVRRINDAGADLVWVGLGAPKQERWMDAHRPLLDAPVLLGVGAAFDFHAGLKRQAPRFVQHSGFEWLFRLVTEPRRLWRRYLFNNPAFVWNVCLEATGLRRFPG
jgi:N-acetylglucosaminyldiphosphoundecaprenol N-acetyl-beta-D-mannosaminyltransferase